MDLVQARSEFFKNQTEENKLKVLNIIQKTSDMIVIEGRKIRNGGKSLFNGLALQEILFFLHLVTAEVNSGVTAVLVPSKIN